MGHVLIIRFHAFGDTLILLPYVQGLKSQYPELTIDLLTLEINASIPKNLKIFDRVMTLPGGRSQAKMGLHFLLNWLVSKGGTYNFVVDLQKNKVSALARALFPGARTSVFEKYAPYFAGERYLTALDALFPGIQPDFRLETSTDIDVSQLLDFSESSNTKYIVINPAGFFPTRNWPIENYLELIRLMIDRWGDLVKLVFLGDSRIGEKVKVIQKHYLSNVINLVNRTSQIEAFSILGKCHLVISEDSGLGHMAWIQGVNTLFLFGSTRADWTAPPYDHVYTFVSSDMDCGDCMRVRCIYDDVKCLTRYTPDIIMDKVNQILSGAQV